MENARRWYGHFFRNRQEFRFRQLSPVKMIISDRFKMDSLKQRRYQRSREKGEGCEFGQGKNRQLGLVRTSENWLSAAHVISRFLTLTEKK